MKVKDLLKFKINYSINNFVPFYKKIKYINFIYFFNHLYLINNNDMSGTYRWYVNIPSTRIIPISCYLCYNNNNFYLSKNWCYNNYLFRQDLFDALNMLDSDGNLKNLDIFALSIYES